MTNRKLSSWAKCTPPLTLSWDVHADRWLLCSHAAVKKSSTFWTINCGPSEPSSTALYIRSQPHGPSPLLGYRILLSVLLSFLSCHYRTNNPPVLKPWGSTLPKWSVHFLEIHFKNIVSTLSPGGKASMAWDWPLASTHCANLHSPYVSMMLCLVKHRIRYHDAILN